MTKKRNQKYNNKNLTDKQIDKIKNVIKEQIDNIRAEYINIDKSKYKLDKNELSDPVDEASVNTIAAQELRLHTRKGFLLKKLIKSYDRINQPDFGECFECSAKITFERLMARPTAELCTNCKEEAEKAKQSNIYLKKSKSIGKTIQLNDR